MQNAPQCDISSQLHTEEFIQQHRDKPALTLLSSSVGTGHQGWNNNIPNGILQE